MIALSTNVFCHFDGCKIVSLDSELGFVSLDLSFTLNSERVYDILQTAPQSGIAIISLHNFVPEPPDGERTFMLSDLDDILRNKAVELTMDTIRLASEVGASAVVLHLGQPRNWDFEAAQNRLREAIHADCNFREIDKLRNEIISTRKDLSSAYLDSILISLDRIMPLAQNLGIRLGVENRYYYGQFPNFEELSIVIQEFSGAPLGYWHDCGHAAHSAYCGFSPITENLDAFIGHQIGFHIHDISRWSDHQVPSPDGDTDFAYILPYIRPETNLVLELGRGKSSMEIGQGIAYLNSCGIY